ncbi:3-oxoacyl-ACP reductase [Streptomyces sp. CB02923]|uniref:SDR family NAD(P)-dependent oxidoreductase n=1 Tax=Streptomyces sp. CB02923 TaxID=1718985 RepID=UPI00093DA994|nr:SDR family oxidoreductase [Streptomyces sp. CB02923]OKI05027.1 3-oxoacyl-ACP reductase [Streptomyces sp. CB02923]
MTDTAPTDPAAVPFPATGRRVLVSGASRGLGRAVAHAFAENGDRVAVHYGSRRADAEETLAALPGSGHVLLGADLADPAGAAALVGAAVEALGGIDVLVNNAAVNTPHPPATTPYDAWTAAWQQHVAVNLLGTAHLSHGAAQAMIAQGTGGRIVNIGSRGAFRGEPDHPAYGATKAAVHALGQSLAVALAPHGIAVASVAPGFIDTDRVSHRLTGAEGTAIRAQSPFGRVAAPEEIAAAVRWLSSPEAQWSSGAVLDLNGASHLRT